jgi:hypothetical protein
MPSSVLYPLSNSALRTASKHGSVKNNQKYCQKQSQRSLISPQKFWHYNGSKMDFLKITYTTNIPNIVQITDRTKLNQLQQEKIKANPCIIYLNNIFQKSLKILTVQIN